MDDLPDVIIGAEVITKTETPDVASEREEIPEEIGTERDAPENVVDNLNDDMADEVMELMISPADDNLEMTKILKTITSRLRKLLKKLSMKIGCLNEISIECLQISTINIPDDSCSKDEIPEEVDAGNEAFKMTV